ncbi:hypothetical protein M422DRAFT_269358 [Sphaerobolus stellatus SS14]|uniref:MYND-type domain-containing protein n=1 Tax=Sphaerobolus stellatus (strain SS14) TaxID=990650 RepID=A0A0C9UK71_SPHS4|nr:hypothetical protein M422DRAFT_237676 [Sphaerobolus stellatus SS14]KIJ29287.1 hypothetical protein M422DRAFT_269358 [Sphaerobolus stellatus SS14]
MPQIFLPLDEITHCQVCGSLKDLRLCSQCGEAAYCSTECQKSDWPTHKKTCKTDRIDLTSFHPVLALIAEAVRVSATGTQRALRHVIVNSPNPGTPAEALPDGTQARIVKLGDPISPEEFSENTFKWWPTAKSEAVRLKLFRRITREGNVLPICLATCLALMHALYSTTTPAAADSPEHRIRLRYKSSPIADFGIARGKIKVAPEDLLAYVLSDGTVIKAQSPDDHYWIYFRTQKGDEAMLDCNMFPFNLCLIGHTRPYVPESVSYVPELVPMCFKDGAAGGGSSAKLAKLASQSEDPGQFLVERARFSVLRNPDILAAFEGVEVRDGSISMIGDVMEAFPEFLATIAGRKITSEERDCLFSTWATGYNVINDAALKDDRWKKFPPRPQIGIETDPGDVKR